MIGERLMMLRDKFGWTQTEMAKRCDVDQTTIQAIESGRSGGTLKTWIKIKRVTGCSLDEIVKGVK